MLSAGCRVRGVSEALRNILGALVRTEGGVAPEKRHPVCFHAVPNKRHLHRLFRVRQR